MKKFLCLAISFVMIFSSFALCVSAGEEDTIMIPGIDLTAGTAGYTYDTANRLSATELEALADIKTVETVEAGTNYKVTDAEGLVKMATLVNTKATAFFKSIVYFANDIDMAGVTDWAPIGNKDGAHNAAHSDTMFRGVLDGQGYTLKNLVVTSDATPADGTFLNVSFIGFLRGGALRNLIVDESCSFTYTGSSTNVRVGLVAFAQMQGPDADGADTNPEFNKDTDAKYGLGQSTENAPIAYLVENVKNNATMCSSVGYASGIIGIINGHTSYGGAISHCEVNGTVKAPTVYGIVNTTTIAARKLFVSNNKVTATLKGDTVFKDVHGTANNLFLVNNDTASATVGSFLELPTDVGYDASKVVVKEGLADLVDLATLSTDGTLNTVDNELWTNTTEFKITDVAGMKLLALLANKLSGGGSLGFQYDNCAGKIFYLANDIDFTGVTDWTPIGYDPIGAEDVSYNRFRGTFDGQGHSIKNLVMTSDVSDGYIQLGLFGTLAHAEVRNLIIDESCSFTYTGTSGGARVGALAGKISVEGAGDKGVFDDEAETPVFYSLIIENVMSKAAVSSNAGYAGGLVGISVAGGNDVAKIDGVTVEANVTAAKAQAAAGILGAVHGRHIEINNAAYKGEVVAKYYAAGIVSSVELAGANQGISVVSNCVAMGKASANAVGAIYVEATAGLINEADCDGSAMVENVVEADPYLGYDKETTVTYEGIVGYDPARVEKKDLSEVLPICAFLVAPEDATEFKICTPVDYIFFATIVNNGINFLGYTIYIANNIDMDGYDVLPIGAPMSGVTTQKNFAGSQINAPAFEGTFDGQGYVIDNLEITSELGEAGTDYVLVGMFGNVRSATVKNVVLGPGCKMTYTGAEATSAYVGGIIANLQRGGYGMSGENDLENLHPAYVDNCYSAATVSGFRAVGGIVGFGEGNTNYQPIHIITNCTNAGPVTSKEWAGGIFGYEARRSTITNCRNIGTITCDLAEVPSTNNRGAAGIIASPATTTTVDGCINNGEIVGPGIVGGMIARLNNSQFVVRNSTNYGDITVTTANLSFGPIYGFTNLNNFAQLPNNADKTGETDASLAAATLDFTNVTYPDFAAIDAEHDELYNVDEPPVTDEPPTTDAPTTDAPSTDAPTTNAPTTNAPTTNASTEKPKKKGCKSSVAGGAVVVLLTAGLAGVMLRKKED